MRVNVHGKIMEQTGAEAKCLEILSSYGYRNVAAKDQEISLLSTDAMEDGVVRMLNALSPFVLEGNVYFDTDENRKLLFFKNGKWMEKTGYTLYLSDEDIKNLQNAGVSIADIIAQIAPAA